LGSSAHFGCRASEILIAKKRQYKQEVCSLATLILDFHVWTDNRIASSDFELLHVDLSNDGYL
jgi:hypothetical protein